MILDPTDQNIRDQGFNFVPFDRYLASRFQPKTLDMSGGITTLPPPIIPPIIPQGGGGDGGGGITTAPPDTSGFDYETDAYNVDTMSAKDKGLTQAEQDALDDLNNPTATPGMLGTTAGMMFGFLNPFTAIASLAYQSRKQREALEAKAREAGQIADTQRAGMGFDFAGTGDKGGGRAGGGGFGGNTAGGFSESDPSATEGSHADGGRVGYVMGGLADLVDIYD